MKITDVKVRPARRFLYVQIETDEGITGIGESGMWGYLLSSGEVIHSFKSYLIGKNPLDIEHHWQYMYRCYYFRGSAVMSAISAIDIALWDIAGKYFGAPIYRLIGGKVRNKIKTYFHVSAKTTEQLLEGCKKAQDMGYKAIGHVCPFLDTPRTEPSCDDYSKKIHDAVERVHAIRDLIGYDMDLCLELHRRLSPAEAITFGNQVAPYLPMFLEDPIRPDNFDSMALVANRIPVPVATGERICTPQEFEMLFSRNAMAYARTSPGLCGGITGTLKIAHIAETYGIQIVPHNAFSPVATATCIQLAAAIENMSILELPNHDIPEDNDLFGEAKMDFVNKGNEPFRQSMLVDKVPKAVDGYITIPEEPGLGINLMPDIENKFPFANKPIVASSKIDGSVADH